MKRFSVNFELTLDIECPDQIDSQWVAEAIALRSKRFSICAAEGDPDFIVVQAASSCLVDIKPYPTASLEHARRLETAPEEVKPAQEQQSPPVSTNLSRLAKVRKLIGFN
jgi:hypothetical protein